MIVVRYYRTLSLLCVLMGASLSMAKGKAGDTSNQGTPQCDKRSTVRDTTKVPRAAVALLAYLTDAGELDAHATGSLISPYTVLTCGHCVWNHKTKKNNGRPMRIMPGAYKNDSNQLIAPFGDYVLTDVRGHKRTTTKYSQGSKKRRGNYDYGAMYVVCPFQHLQTHMPITFRSKKKTVRVNGYPTEGLGQRFQSGDQLTGKGKVTWNWGRTMNYKVRSTGGASGAPVMEWDSGSRTMRQSAINTYHTNECNGGGIKLVNGNRDLIVKWMKWRPSAADKQRVSCKTSFPRRSWSQLKAKYKKSGSSLRSAKALRLKKKPAIVINSIDADVYQYIEGTLYHWLEYEGTGNKRYLRMKAPIDKWLTVKEGQILLTASAKWKRPNFNAKPLMKRVALKGKLKALKMPSIKDLKRDVDEKNDR